MIQQRIDALRRWCRERNLDAFIVPSSDPHASEYPASHFASRAWFTGFTGSAGTAVVMADGGAALWTDSRYFLQAEQQLAGSGIELMRSGEVGVASVAGWVVSQLGSRGVVGVDGRLFSVDQFEELRSELAVHGVELLVEGDPFDEIWSDRPKLPHREIYCMEEAVAGESARSKIERVTSSCVSDIDEGGVICVTRLDSIAWLLNLRGSDVECTPLFMAYLVLDGGRGVLFVNPSALDCSSVSKGEICEYLAMQGVEVRGYDQWEEYLATLADRRVVVDPSSLDIRSNWVLQRVGACVVDGGSALYIAQATHNAVQLDGFRRAMVEDGRALVRFEMWLDGAVNASSSTLGHGVGCSEVSAAKKLHELRAESPDFVSDSFAAIVGYGAHGAVVHYSATEQSDVVVGVDSLLLVDSGGQYRYGTTDITRAFHFGVPTVAQMRDYTNVLRGLINLSSARFPVGTRGAQLDALARIFLWRDGANYLHGTGHGVGHFLSVHQGPQSIRMNENPVALVPGMVQSCEPGVYRTGMWGIRLENLIAVQSSLNGISDNYYEFETLTLYPFERKLILVDELTTDEREWIDRYHAHVYAALATVLTDAERQFLAAKTAAL